MVTCDLGLGVGDELLIDFLLGLCPAAALQANLGARLVALNKKGGGIRPVAMGRVIRRLAARAACKVLKNSVAAVVATSVESGAVLVVNSSTSWSLLTQMRI